MASKSILLLATFLSVLLATATATTFTTTVTTTSTDDEANPRGQTGQCEQHLQGRQFNLCKRYLIQRGRQYDDAEEALIEMGTNPQGGQEFEAIRGCCHEMRALPQECRCRALNQIVRQQQQQGAVRGQQLQEVYQRVRSLPQLCNPQAGECQIESRSVFL